MGPRWTTIATNISRISGLPELQHATVPDGAPDLRTTLGVQRALTRLGTPLEQDGARGPLTIAAIRAFQLAHALTPDALVGPLTRQALEQALATIAPT